MPKAKSRVTQLTGGRTTCALSISTAVAGAKKRKKNRKTGAPDSRPGAEEEPKTSVKQHGANATLTTGHQKEIFSKSLVCLRSRFRGCGERG